MGRTKRQALALLLFSIAFSLFAMWHSLVVDVDYEACFGNYAAAVNGERPYLRVEEMSFRALARAAAGNFSPSTLIIGALGLLPLFPFVTAWFFSGDARTRMFWVVSALCALIVMVSAISMRSLTEFYDCDLNGVSMGVLFAPIFYMLLNMAAAAVLFVVYYVLRLFVFGVRER
nr:hypothetical protein [uncultured Sphingomonas sp.]